MAEVIVLEFSAPEAASIYNKVNELLGVNPASGAGDWPRGLMSHVAGEAGDKLVVVEVWASKAAQEEFMASRLGPAFGEAQAPAPIRAEWFSAIGQMHRH